MAKLSQKAITNLLNTETAIPRPFRIHGNAFIFTTKNRMSQCIHFKKYITGSSLNLFYVGIFIKHSLWSF